MDLRDTVEEVAALDDEQRAIVNEINRAFDGLERAVLPEERFGVSRDSLSALRERLAHGSVESSPFSEVAATVQRRILADTRAETERIARGTHETAAAQAAHLDRLEQRLRDGLDRARAAFEEVGRLRHLQARRAELDGRLAAARACLGEDQAGQELLDLVLAARRGAAERAALDAGTFLGEAEQAAAEDGTLAGLAANVRALREALAAGRETEAIAADLVGRVVALGVRLGRERAELRRELARLAQSVEHRQARSRGLFHAVTLASEVLERAAQLEQRLAQEPGRPAALAPLRAACLEQGLVSLLLSLTDVRVPAAELDRAASVLSAGLGDVLMGLARRADDARLLAPAWDELAAVDPAALEAEWEAAACDALGVSRDAQALFAVSPDRLAELAQAGSLDPWKQRLLDWLVSREEAATQVPARLATVREELERLAEDEDEKVASAAARALPALDAFVATARRARADYLAALRQRLLDTRLGFDLLSERLAPFAGSPPRAAEATAAEQRAATAATLSAVRATFSRLESEVLGASGSASSDLREVEDSTVNLTVGLQRTLAGVLARRRRLDGLLFPRLDRTCREALALARSLRDSPQAGRPGAAYRDRLGEALEALYFEKQVLERLALPAEAEQGVLSDLSRHRHRRLLDLSEASLTLLFRLLTVLAHEYDGLPGEERAGHVSWIQELVLHARSEVARHATRLEQSLTELADNEERLARFAAAFDAYHAWAQAISETEAGLELLAVRGPRTFEELEEPFGRLAEATLARLATAPADWRAVADLENLGLLLERACEHVERHPTLTPLAERLAERRREAATVLERSLARAEESAPAQQGGLGLLFAP